MLSKTDLEAIKSVVTEIVGESEKKTQNKIAENQDKIMSRLDTIDQELAVTNGFGDQLEDHETRIKKIEKRNLTQ